MSADQGGRKKRPPATEVAGKKARLKAKAPAKARGAAAANGAPGTKAGKGTKGAAATKGAKKDKAAKGTRGAAGTKGARGKTATASPAGTRTGSGASRSRRGAKLDAKAIAAIRAGLVAEKAELLRRQAELDQESFDGSQSEMTGEVGLGEDYADAGTATFDRERDLSIRNNIQDLMDQIDRAVERIDAGTYGICERCGRPIEAARLKALHSAVLCLDCKRREERSR